MIRPETNLNRQAISLDGIWACRPDLEEIGASEGWQYGFEDGLAIAVPGSWNEQLSETGMMNHEGVVWYQRDVLIPQFSQSKIEGQDLTLYFGSVDYHGEVFIDGKHVGTSGVPVLPFELTITDNAAPGRVVKLVVKVDARLPEHGPMQRVTREDYVNENRMKDENWPAVRFDFFPFGGLNRSVYLCLLPKNRITELRIDTGWTGQVGTLSVLAEAKSGHIEILLDGRKLLMPSDQDSALGQMIKFELPDTAPWSPDDPKLYELCVILTDDEGRAMDTITQRIGFRSVLIEGENFILNGAPIQLKGFGKHEDTPVSGRGVNLPMLIKDFQLLKWTGANSVRTSHYPYDQSFLDMADEQGVLVISEIFSVNLDFRRTDESDLSAHKDSASALIARDRAHACVVAWSLSNEPGFLGEPEYQERSGAYWAALFTHARSLDDTRPMTVSNVQYAGVADPVFDESDFVTINRYFGWYTEPGQLDLARARLIDIFDTLQTSYGKPIFVSEFGADAVAGMHATTDQMWTEDYQSDLIELYWEIIEQHPACIGGHVWNFADFRTAQHARRVVMNHKGVFTRARDPKRAAFTVRRLWGGDKRA